MLRHPRYWFMLILYFLRDYLLQKPQDSLVQTSPKPPHSMTESFHVQYSTALDVLNRTLGHTSCTFIFSKCVGPKVVATVEVVVWGCSILRKDTSTYTLGESNQQTSNNKMLVIPLSHSSACFLSLSTDQFLPTKLPQNYHINNTQTGEVADKTKTCFLTPQTDLQ